MILYVMYKFKINFNKQCTHTTKFNIFIFWTFTCIIYCLVYRLLINLFDMTYFGIVFNHTCVYKLIVRDTFWNNSTTVKCVKM